MAGIFGIEGRPERGTPEAGLRAAVSALVVGVSTLPIAQLGELITSAAMSRSGIMRVGRWRILDRRPYARDREIAAARRTSTSADDILSLLLQAPDRGRRDADRQRAPRRAADPGARRPRDDGELARLGWERLVRTPARLRAPARGGRGRRDADEEIEATIYEDDALRPVIPIDRPAGRCVPWQLGDYAVPADTPIVISILLLHHREDVYPEPIRVPARALARAASPAPTRGSRSAAASAAASARPRDGRAARRARGDGPRALDLEAADPEPEHALHRNVTMIRGAARAIRRARALESVPRRRRRSPASAGARGRRSGPRRPRSRTRGGRGRPAPRRRSPRPTGGSSPAGPRSATRPRRATRRARRARCARRARRASGWRNETMPPKPGQRTSSTPARCRSHSLTARPFSVWRATRSARVRSPRWTRKQSNGPGTAPTEFWTKRTRSCSSASAQITRARRRRRSGRRGTWWSSGRPRSRRARAGAGRSAWRRCCRRPPRRLGRLGDDGGDVDLVEQRVGRRLDPDQLRLGAQRGAQGVEVALVDEVVGEPEAGEDLVDQAVGAAVEVERQDQVVAGRERRGQQRVGRRHAARERRAVPPSSSPSAARARSGSGSPSARSRSRSTNSPGAGWTKVEVWWIGGITEP